MCYSSILNSLANNGLYCYTIYRFTNKYLNFIDFILFLREKKRDNLNTVSLFLTFFVFFVFFVFKQPLAVPYEIHHERR